MANQVMFGILSAVILAAALFCVTTKRIMRAATALLFVLFGVAGIYFLLDYTFLGAVQISIYAGGITMIYIFAIQLVSKRTLQGLTERIKGSRVLAGLLASLAGLAIVVFTLIKYEFVNLAMTQPDVEVPMETIGTALMGAGKYQYVFPFEFISLFLLACIIGELVLLNHKKEEK